MEEHDILTDKTKIVMIDVALGAKECYNEPGNAKLLWCRLLLAKSEEEQESILKDIGDKVMKKRLKKKLKDETKKYSADDEVWGLYTELSHDEIVKNTIRENSLNEGRDAGREEGIIMGEAKAKLEDAKNLLELGVDIDIITEATGLTEDEILSHKR